MSWIALSILSALCLGGYDLLKKNAVRENAVLPVLFYGVLTGALIWLPLLIFSHLTPQLLPSIYFKVDSLSRFEHGWIFVKSALVSVSWLFGYFSLKHLPLTTAGPIRSTGPLWTILIAVCFFGEQPSRYQWLGIIVILGSFYAFALVGKKEGFHFSKNRWVWFMIAATIMGATSSICDKYLLQKVGLEPVTVQAWFSIYLAVILFPFYLGWKRGLWKTGTFQWRWSIPFIGVGLLIADIFYFSAVHQPDALISVISPVRRMAVVVTFLGGVLMLKERTNVARKAFCLAGMLAGIYLVNLT